MWPLSCYGHGAEAPTCIAMDESPEEHRWNLIQAYNAGPQAVGQVEAHYADLVGKIQNAKKAVCTNPALLLQVGFYCFILFAVPWFLFVGLFAVFVRSRN